MAITLDEIVEEAARLPDDVVAEITSGQVKGIPLEESLARASRLLRP